MTAGMMPTVATVAIGAMFAAVGAICAFWPRAVQRYTLSDSYSRRNPALRLRLVRKHVASTGYVWELRVGGALSLAAAAVIAYLLLSGPRR